MKHVCFVSLNGYKLFNSTSSAQVGGTEVQMSLIAHALAATGRYQIFMIVGHFGQPLVEQFGPITLYRSIRLIKKLSNIYIAPFVLWQTLRRVNADVYISSPAGPEIGIIGLFCHLYKRTFIYRSASDVDCTYVKMKSLGWMGSLLYRFGMRMATVVVTQNSQQERSARHYFGRDGVMLPNGFPVPVLIPTDRAGVLWVGSARAVKQARIFLRLAQSLPHYPFVMIMSRSGDERIFQDTARAAARIPNLRFTGEVPFKDMSGYFQQAKIIVGTSAYEGFPNVYIQACLAATPIVSWTVNPNGFITRYRTGYVAGKNFEALQEAVISLMTAPSKWREMSRAARDYGLRYHSLDMVVKKWQKLIDKLWLPGKFTPHIHSQRETILKGSIQPIHQTPERN